MPKVDQLLDKGESKRMAARLVARGRNAPILRERLRCARAVRAAKLERAKIATELARAAGVADAYNALVATNTGEEVALDGREGSSCCEILRLTLVYASRSKRGRRRNSHPLGILTSKL